MGAIKNIYIKIDGGGGGGGRGGTLYHQQYHQLLLCDSCLDWVCGSCVRIVLHLTKKFNCALNYNSV